jgi:DNA-binding PadR family transcriptional regulator
MHEGRWNEEERGRGRRGPGRGGCGPEGFEGYGSEGPRVRFDRGGSRRGSFGPGGPGGPGGAGGRGGPGGGGGPGGRGSRGFASEVFGSEGPGGPFGPRGFRRGQRARRGDVRAAILDLLAEGEPTNGYQVIQEIAERTQGVWRPSAGSVYPALAQLEDEGLIAPEGEGRRKLYSLTDEGRAYVERHADELRRSWDAAQQGMADDVLLEVRDLIRQVTLAVMEVARAGTDSQLRQARQTLTETRRSLYRLLADGDVADAPSDADASADAPGDEENETE